MTINLILDAAWKILAIGLALGAGLPALFAVGIKSMAFGLGGDAEIDHNAKAHPMGRVLGVLCFALVACGVLIGIAIIVAGGFGKEVSFDHIYPMIVDKKK